MGKTTTKMKKFLQVLELYPFCKDFWYQKNGEWLVDIEGIKESLSLGRYSSWETHIIKWLVWVFTGENILEFYIIECVGVLDKNHLDVICDFWEERVLDENKRRWMV